MAFHFYIAANPIWISPTITLPSFAIDCPFYKNHHPWSLPGTINSFAFSVDEETTFELTAKIEFQDKVVEYSYLGLKNRDHLNVFAIDPFNYISSIFHEQQDTMLAQCVARCADGKSAPVCVVCKAGGITVKVCC